MKRKIILRSFLGALCGLAISTLITTLISICIRDGHYYPVAPKLVDNFGSELNAVLVQTACALLYGAAWAGASTIWEKERWSLLRQTVTHLLICSFSTLPIAYWMYWMPHSPAGILLYFSIFFGVYLCIWLSQYAAMKKRIRQLNDKVKDG